MGINFNILIQPIDGAAQAVDSKHRHGGVLLRHTQPMAKGRQRKHEWPSSPVLAQGHASQIESHFADAACCTKSLTLAPTQ